MVWFIYGGLPKACEVDTIMVVVDRLTKYAHFVAIVHPYTARDIAAVFVKGSVDSLVDWEGQGIHEFILDGVIQSGWNQAKVFFSLPSSIR